MYCVYVYTHKYTNMYKYYIYTNIHVELVYIYSTIYRYEYIYL